jgi:hypothetical protein
MIERCSTYVVGEKVLVPAVVYGLDQYRGELVVGVAPCVDAQSRRAWWIYDPELIVKMDTQEFSDGAGV